MPEHIDSDHKERRAVLRAVGPAVLGLGILFTAIGIGSFFASFGTFGPPRYFWCAFIGLPLVALGSAICKFAFMGAALRYMANEGAPVGKDTFNYMAHGTKGAVREAATAVGEGLSVAGGRQVLRCHKCNETNDASARFCNGCGAALDKSVACGQCGELNDPDARFCDNCGVQVG